MEENQIQIPEGWAKQKGDNLFKVQGGYAFKSNDYKDEGVLLVRISNVGNNNFIYKDLIYVPKRFLTSHSNFLLDKDDVLMGLTGDLGKICILENGEFPFILNQRVGRFIFNEKVNNRFLYYLISSSTIQNKFDAFFTGGAQKNISPKQIESVEYIVPKSTTEQQSIASILSKTDQAIANTEALIAKYTQIKTGLMQDLLTKGIDENGNIRTEQTHEFKDSPLGRIPKEWECEIIDNIYDLRSGITPLRSNKKYFSDEGYNWVKTLDLNEDYLYSTEEKISQFALDSISIQLMPINSILIAMYGGWEQIGRTSIIKEEAATNQAITCLFNPKKEMNADYVQLVLQQYRYKWKQYAVSTRKDPNITKTDIKNFILAFPIDVKEQDKIVDKIMKTKDFVSKSKTELSKLQSLKTGLMQDLLSGKVRVNNLMKEKQN